MKKNIFIIFIFLSLVLISCKKSDSTTTPLGNKDRTRKQELTIGLSIDTIAIERWQRDLDVFINKAKELNANVIVQNAGNDVDEQNRQLMYLCDCGVDVILIISKKADGLVDTIQKIKSKNIPIISYDRLILNSPIDLYITINSVEVGEIMAKRMLQVAKGPNWYLILGPKEDYNMTFIQQGINKIISNTDIKIKYIYYTNGWNYDLSYKEAVKLLTQNLIPDCFICGNDAVADSVRQAIDEYSSNKKIPLCGQDGDIIACQNIVNGLQDFTVYKPINELAEKAAEYAVLFAENKDSSNITNNFETINNGYADIPVVWLHPQIVDKNNLDKVIIQSGFHTKKEIYLDNSK